MQHENLSDHLSPLTFVIGSGGERLRHFVARSIHLLFHCLPPVKLHEKLSDHPSISSLDTFFNNNAGKGSKQGFHLFSLNFHVQLVKEFSAFPPRPLSTQKSTGR